MAAVPSKEKKRDIADFFKSYARARHFPAAVVPQKRPSPSPNAETEIPPRVASTGTATPSKQRIPRPTVSPLTPSQARASTPSSAKLVIRTPRAKPRGPSSSHKDGRSHSEEKEVLSPSVPLSPSPRRQTLLNFDHPPAPAQSIVREGKVVAVRDSDEETDSLASLDELIGRKRDEDETSASSPPDPGEAQTAADRRKMLGVPTYGRSEPIVGKEKLRQLRALDKQYQFDISGLLNDHFDDQEINLAIERSRSRHEDTANGLEGGKRKDHDEELLASLNKHAGGDEDDLTRLKGAIARTEALTWEKSYSFLGSSSTRDQGLSPPILRDFPEPVLVHTLSEADVGNDAARDRLYRSGLFAELAACGSLSDKILRWTFEEIQEEQNDQLRYAYLECLRRGSFGWTRTAITAQDVRSSFERLGAREECVRGRQRIEPRHQPLRKQTVQSVRPLLTVLELYRAICSHMDFLALSTLTSILCRIAVDADLMSIGQLASEVEESFSQLLQLTEKQASAHVAQHMFDDLRTNLDDPSLQAELLSHLLPSSPRACSLRIKLATIFLYESKTDVPESLTQSQHICLSSLASHISKSPSFATSSRRNKLNYAHLRALTHILDIAIGDGGRPATFASRTEEDSFNATVDALADVLKQIYEAINDTGATHMRRTEAKDVLQSLQWRLLYAVRTKHRPRKHVFDAETGRLRNTEEVKAEQRGKDFMSQFLTRMKEKKKADDGDSLLGSQSTFDSSRSDSEQLIRRQLGLDE